MSSVRSRRYNVRVLRKGVKGMYVTTIHCISSAIIKLARLQTTATVYRGVAGGVLPDSFFTPDEKGAIGGVEAAFMSTSTNREVAMEFARRRMPPPLDPETLRRASLSALVASIYAESSALSSSPVRPVVEQAARMARRAPRCSSTSRWA